MTLRALVFQSLDNAFDNGYDQRNVDTLTVVEDLMSIDAVCEKCSEQELFPFVEEWQKERKK